MSHWERTLGPIHLGVEHRRAADDAGPTLRVREGRGGRELLRFDCFDRAPHFHVDPAGRDELTRLDPLRDNVAWTLRELRRDLPRYLEKAGFEPGTSGLPWSAAERDACLREAEAAMRNPPADLDDLSLEVLKTRLSEKWNTFPSDVLPAWVAEMDFPLAEPIRRVLDHAVRRSDLGYAIEPRKTGLPEVFAGRMADRFGWEVDPARVALLADVVQALYVAIERFSEPGDGAIVQTPIYPPFLSAVANTGRRLVENRLLPGESRWEIDFDALRADVDPRTRLLLLCNPHNPTGRAFTRAELEALAALALENDWVVVADEIHADLVYAGGAHLPFATLGPEVAARTITLTSATKAFNIPGLRCAVAHFGSEALHRRFDLPPTRHVRGGLGLLGLYATIAAWRDSQPWLDQVLAYLADNRARVLRFVDESLPGVTCHEPEATYLAWLDFRALSLPTTPARHLVREARVALSDGRYFGAAFEGYARLNFATSRAILDQVLERVAAALEARG